MSDYNVFEPVHSAYRRHHSSESALVRVNNDVFRASLIYRQAGAL